MRIAVASGNVTQTFLGGFQGRYERVLFGESCEKLAKEARKAKPRELLLANDEYDDPERKRRLIRREEKKRRNIRIKALTPSKSQRDETVAIVFIHVTLRASMSTREVQTLRRFVQRARKVWPAPRRHVSTTRRRRRRLARHRRRVSNAIRERFFTRKIRGVEKCASIQPHHFSIA